MRSGSTAHVRQRADDQRRGHEYHLVDERSFGHRPHDGQLAIGPYAGDLLCVQRQVVAKQPGRLLGQRPW